MEKNILKLYKIFIGLFCKKSSDLNEVYCKNSSSIISIGANHILEINSKKEKIKDIVNSEVKKIVKENLNSPDNLLKFIENNGTKVYRFKNASKILNFINTEEGFIIPNDGLNALILHLGTGIMCDKQLNLSLTANPIFIIGVGDIDIYSLSHQFHKWYSYKNNLPGYDKKNKENFRKSLKTLHSNSNNLSIKEVILLKEAINRDKEAIDFVISLTNEG